MVLEHEQSLRTWECRRILLILLSLGILFNLCFFYFRRHPLGHHPWRDDPHLRGRHRGRALLLSLLQLDPQGVGHLEEGQRRLGHRSTRPDRFRRLRGQEQRWRNWLCGQERFGCGGRGAEAAGGDGAVGADQEAVVPQGRIQGVS